MSFPNQLSKRSSLVIKNEKISSHTRSAKSLGGSHGPFRFLIGLNYLSPLPLFRKLHLQSEITLQLSI